MDEINTWIGYGNVWRVAMPVCGIPVSAKSTAYAQCQPVQIFHNIAMPGCTISMEITIKDSKRREILFRDFGTVERIKDRLNAQYEAMAFSLLVTKHKRLKILFKDFGTMNRALLKRLEKYRLEVYAEARRRVILFRKF